MTPAAVIQDAQLNDEEQPLPGGCVHALKAFNEIIDGICGGRESVMRIINAAVFGIVAVVSVMLYGETQIVELKKQNAQLKFQGAVLDGMVNDVAHPDEFVWYKDARCWMWIGMLVLSLCFMFVLNFFIALLKSAERGEQRVQDEIIDKPADKNESRKEQ